MRELDSIRKHASRISVEVPMLRNRLYSRSTVQRRHARITATRPVVIHNPTTRGTMARRPRSSNTTLLTKYRGKERPPSTEDKRKITVLAAFVMITLLLSLLYIRFLSFLLFLLPLRKMSGLLSKVCKALEHAIRDLLALETEDTSNIKLTDASTGTEDLKEWSRGSEHGKDPYESAQNTQQLPGPDQDHEEDHDTDGENSNWTAKTGDLKSWLKSVGFTHNDASHVESYREVISEFITSVRNAGWLSPTAEGAGGPANVTQVPTPRAPPSSPQRSVHSSRSNSVDLERRGIPLVTARISSGELKDLDAFWPVPESAHPPISVRASSHHATPSKGGNFTPMGKSFTPMSNNRNHFRRRTCTPTPVGQLMDKAMKVIGNRARPSTTDPLPLVGENAIPTRSDFVHTSTTEVFRDCCPSHGSSEGDYIGPPSPRGPEPYLRILPGDYFSSFYGRGDCISELEGENEQASCTIFEDSLGDPRKPCPLASAPVTPKKCRVSKLPIRRPKSSSPRFSKLTESRMLKYKGSLKKKPLATAPLNTTPRFGSPLRTTPTPSPQATPKASLSMRRIILSTATEELFTAESDNEEDTFFNSSSGRNTVRVRDEGLEDFFRCT
ncbi:MAG: hypothetical protein M1839_006630 [Geoglossum umbratile]|nr:MAG: hypothetical protein M1839_006630 [Geoglossum umbratile]